ncbi:MAG: DUF1501 domain-containing protein [Pseudarcicella sp.]|nr:DUF1501 domain-containing protein [Pseudarcicella sp.]MBP6410977.1 DUF1501 domain-containing protein [Pseudarcicella sp.]
MKRRDFIQLATSSLAIPLVLDGFGATAYNKPNTKFMAAIQDLAASSSDRILVVIQLKGGNDGLNTVIPLDQYQSYASQGVRGNIAIPENKVLKLKSNSNIGFHPSLVGFQNLYNEGKLSIVHSAGYPKPSFSHNEATNIWQTGASKPGEMLNTGWLGRYLDDFNLSDYSDPLAIQIDAVASAAFNSEKNNPALAINNVDSFIKNIGTNSYVLDGALPNSTVGNFVSFMRDQQTLSLKYGASLKSANEKGQNKVEYPTGNTLATQLQTVAKLISGGLNTKVYYVSLGSFDTHSKQVESTDTTTGEHAMLLSKLSEAVDVFMKDMIAQGQDNKIIGMTFSEFGRRAVSNGSYGTDHGWASPMFVFGNAVENQVIGKTPDLQDLENNNIKLQNEFHTVYAAVLRDWMGASSQTVNEILQNKNYEAAPIFTKAAVLSNERLKIEKSFNVFPNPSASYVTMESEVLANANTNWVFTDMTARQINVNSTKLASNKVRLDVSQLPVGRYLVKVNTPMGSFIKPILVAK